MTLICNVTGLVGQQCDPWIRQLMTLGDVESSASSYSQLCSGEAIGRPWYSQIDVDTSAHLITVAVALSSEVPVSYALLGALGSSATLWGSVWEQHHC